MNSNSRHRAYTLIEVVVVMSVSSTLMVLAIGWICHSMKFGSLVRSRQTQHQSLLRLANLFRDDVHQGISMAFVNDNEMVITSVIQQQVSYTLSPTIVSRTVREGGKVIARDAFPFTPTSITRWDASGLPTTIALLVERGNGLPGTTNHSDAASERRPVDLHVRASLRGFQVDNGEPQ